MKRLICCLDGTWNDDTSESTPTNVLKLSRAIPTEAGGARQVVKYIVGVGTGYGGKLGFGIGASGIEVGARVLEGYAFLVEHYEPGDEIYLFGFSRGAFQARSLAGFIALVGIAKRGNGFSSDEAWQAYRAGKGEADEATLAKLRTAAHFPAPIKLVGVWDTVGNLGNPLMPWGRIAKRFRFHDTRLTETTDVGLHALSIDEKRGPFRPTMWTLPTGASLRQGQHAEQVWFAGVHADVGGGYKATALSDIALLWMAERAAATTGLGVDLDKLRRDAKPDPLGVQHSSTTGKIFKWSAWLPFVRLVHQRAAGVGYLRRLLLGRWRTGRVARGQVMINEQIHPSVRARFSNEVSEDAGGEMRRFTYRPRNLAAALKAEKRSKKA